MTKNERVNKYYHANRERILARRRELVLAETLEQKEKKKLYMRQYLARPDRRLKERERASIRSQTPERLDYIFKRKYGISLERYNELFKIQGGVCAICGGNRGKRRLAVDHDHATGTVRGLLCGLCNITVGLVEDSEILLEKTRLYLRKHSQLRLVS